MAKPAGVVAMAMRNYNEVQVFQVDIQRSGIGRKDFGIIAGIKQNLLACIFDQDRESPILLQFFRISESVVKDSCPAVCVSGTDAAQTQQQAAKQGKVVRC